MRIVKYDKPKTSTKLTFRRSRKSRQKRNKLEQREKMEVAVEIAVPLRLENGVK